MDVIITSPQVTYRMFMNGDKRSDFSRLHSELVERDGKVFTYVNLSNPEDLPRRELFLHLEEPIAKIELITPREYVGALMQLSQERRGIFLNQHFLDEDRVMLTYELPMSELI